MDAGSDAGPRYAFPLTLTPLTTATTSTANISLYFSVTDKNGLGVAGLPASVLAPPKDMDPFNWVYREDNVDLDPAESGFTVTPLQGSTLDMPTVLVLDLSGSIVANGVLPTLKTAAKAIIDAMLPEQKMAVVTFADAGTVRVPLTADKAMLKSSVDAITMGDGFSTNLYGAMIQAFGLWQDGFTSAGSMSKLTAGLAVVLTDGKDQAGVKTLSDVIAARKNKRVVSVGIGTNINKDAMVQMSTTGTFVQVTSFQTLTTEVAQITHAMQTLGRSIYTANYCSPKRAGMHELTFSLKGNSNTAMTTCTPATFPASQPSMCAGLDPSYTQACGNTKGGNTYFCCKADTPYTCPNDTLCYATAAAAAAKCGASSVGGTGGCILCGGTGQGASQDTQLVPGEAIRVRFNAQSYSSGQCSQFWGPNCKALQECCGRVPTDQMATCNAQLMSAQGNEAMCLTQTMSNCPALGPQCTALGTCCGTYSGTTQQTCQNGLFAAHGMEAQCTMLAGQYCPTGTNCTALKACCASFAGNVQQQCYQAVISASGAEPQCTTMSAGYCPTGANCQKLKTCCGAKTGPARESCEQQLVGASGNEASCQSYLTSNQCP